MLELNVESIEMLQAAQAGDACALDQYVESNMRLVKSLVKRFLGRGIEYEDLCQIGALGLIKAIKRFDTSLGLQFSTYAVPMIIGEIKRHLRDDGMIKVSRKTKEAAMQVSAVRKQLAAKLGREPLLSELEKETGISQTELSMIFDATAPVTSIYSPIYGADSDSDAMLIDTLDSGKNMENEVITSVALYNAIKTFKPREQQVITLRYYSQKTQMEVASMLGISQVQVSRIEKKVLSLLRQNLEN